MLYSKFTYNFRCMLLLFADGPMQELQLHTTSCNSVDCLGDMLVAGEGRATHLWSAEGNDCGLFEFVAIYHWSRDVSVKAVRVISKERFVSLDYSGTVSVWNKRSRWLTFSLVHFSIQLVG